ncbi:synaptotagmin-16 isoform X2 [Macrosteles quadrilineatus]|uniref:synaptotagmin-16 isoform X2 n=1 Tax=Macrosteles quadrilineatus TaxID=74068 RepID=UPI0023E0D2CF|nr:synaptotagmin-16 isoform X2 [Macrosteles quadrilineatus]
MSNNRTGAEMIAGPDQHSNVPTEATAFLGAVAAFLVLLLVFFLYFNKKWCFYAITCCDDPPPISSSAKELETGPTKGADLMSLAEKGKVGRAGSSASSSCSTTSGEDDSHGMRHRDNRRPSYHKQTSVDEEIAPLVSNTNSQDCIVVVGQEPLFDVTDLQSMGTVDMARCGAVEVAFAYDAPMRKMTVHVLQARDIPAKDRGGASHTQVRILLLPSKKQKHKSKIRHGENPQFMESFLFHRVNPEDVNSMGIRLRLYGCERMRRERMIGETIMSFSCVNLELESNMWLPLEPRSNITLNTSSSDLLSLARSDSTGSTHSMQHGGVPELLIGLAYNGTTGRLAIEIVKGSHFRNLAMTRAPDTYVKLTLVSSMGQEMARSKTSVRRGQPNPLFKETFMFQVALFQLPDVTLMIAVYNKRSMKRKEMIGWFSLGLNSSGEEELAHWEDMRQVRGEQICRWHILVDS